MQEAFTIEEIRTYLLSKDSMGDILHYLSAENIRKANAEKEVQTRIDENNDNPNRHWVRG